ncbi:C40 family peptidase [Streptomyces sp. NEAU-YJ-81]|uniref:C40 family peptidase n=1 Tax=Streptomyces sp. NEAU-YJ-81 TaxID=2820288 RepID=UPI001ABC80E9|nr:C40 family peptidase [Streptomyces sp. NEAU-YJ-81]MBO3674512.1 C40 family peptidase [Streptomyces sp. NEAU-YJ-81]
MSPVAHIPSHRKPRRAASTRALRAGMTGGFLTLAVAGAAVPASATESKAAPAESTLEMPTVSATLASTAAQTADATQQAASDYELQAQQEQAEAHAKIAAKKAKAEADRKAKEAREAARKAAAKRAAEAKSQAAKASRSAERTTLSTTSVSNATGNAATLISFLKAQLGKAYVLGSSGPSSYDCSGLTQAAFKQVGVSLPRVSQDQSTTGTPVSLDSLQPGDLLYWGSAGSAYHVGVYVGGGNFIGAQNSSTGIVERPLDYDMPTGAVRVL